jgi:hypothetical protein
MTGFLKGRAVGQVDKLLIDGKEYTREDIFKMIKNSKISPAKKKDF